MCFGGLVWGHLFASSCLGCVSDRTYTKMPKPCKVHVATDNMRCPWGSFLRQSQDSIDCVPCGEGYFHVDPNSSKPCVACPVDSKECLPHKLKMRRGFMLQNLRNETMTELLACPNPSACRGEAPGSMCQAGYLGAGCAQCDGGYTPSDSNVLTCVKCAETAMLHVAQVVLWLAKLAVFFGLAAKSVLGSTIPAKASSVYLNQLISFSTLSGTVVSALLQTPIGQEMQAGAMGIVFGVAGLITDLGSGQGGGDSAGQSLQCSLAYAGLQPAIWKGNVAFVLVAFGMMSGLAGLKGSQVALVVGANCFLPTLMTHFGRQLVCYRLSEAADKLLECPHVPTFPGGFSFVLCMAIGSASAVVYAWWRLYPKAQEILGSCWKSFQLLQLLLFWLCKGAFKVSLGIVSCHMSIHGTDFENSEIASPVAAACGFNI